MILADLTGFRKPVRSKIMDNSYNSKGNGFWHKMVTKFCFSVLLNYANRLPHSIKRYIKNDFPYLVGIRLGDMKNGEDRKLARQ